MSYFEWRKTVWPTLSSEKKAEITAEVRTLRTDGWDMQEAWIQAACTV